MILTASGQWVFFWIPFSRLCLSFLLAACLSHSPLPHPHPSLSLSASLTQIFWQQQAHQALLMQSIRPPGAILSPPLQPQTSPQIILPQSDASVSPILMHDTRTTEAPAGRRVTFPQTSDNIDNDDNYRSRPKRLFLGTSNTGNSNALTPSTPHAGNFSTVSTPHGANTPAGDGTPMGLCSPTTVKPFPDNTFRSNQLRDPLPITSPVPASPLTSPRPTPRSLSLGHMDPISPMPAYSGNTAITPQRQIFAHSLLELAQHSDPPGNRPMSQDFDSGSRDADVISMPTQGLQAPPLLAPNDDGLQQMADMGAGGQNSHINTSGENILTGLNTQSNMLQFPPSLPMSGRSSSYNQMEMTSQPMQSMQRSQPVLPPNSIPLNEGGSSDNILTTPCDPNMGAPPTLSMAPEEDLDMVPQTRAPGNQPWSRDEGSESSDGPESELPRPPQNDSANSLLMLSGQRPV